jgi:predicted transcriptional regulator
MADATFTFRVDDELKARFTEAARAQDRTGAQLLRDYMRDYVRRQQEEPGYDAWFRRQVETARDAANAGDLVAAEEVEAEFAKRRAETRRKLRRRKS